MYLEQNVILSKLIKKYAACAFIREPTKVTDKAHDEVHGALQKSINTGMYIGKYFDTFLKHIWRTFESIARTKNVSISD